MPAVPHTAGARPRVLFVGRTRYPAPLDPAHDRKFAALERVFDYRMLAASARAGQGEIPRFRLVDPVRPRLLDGPLFYAALPLRIARELRDQRSDVVIAQSPFEAAAALVARRLARSRAAVVCEIHGDWRASTRLYGSRVRAWFAPLADALASAAIRRSDAVRTVSDFTSGLVRDVGAEPAAVFRTYAEIESFGGEAVPLPATPRLLFVGVLERYKNIDGLAEAWRLAAPRLPGVTLELVGNGARVQVVERLLADVPGQTEWHARLDPDEVAAALDRATALVLPSFSEGLPRVVAEALRRGRPVVASRAGGIPDAVEDGRNGILVPPGDAPALADALVRLVGDRPLAERLAAGALETAERWAMETDEYVARMTELVGSVGRS